MPENVHKQQIYAPAGTRSFTMKRRVTYIILRYEKLINHVPLSKEDFWLSRKYSLAMIYSEQQDLSSNFVNRT